jgi:hypothetical protein
MYTTKITLGNVAYGYLSLHPCTLKLAFLAHMHITRKATQRVTRHIQIGNTRCMHWIYDTT